MEYLIRNRPHATLTITIFFFGDDTYAVVNIDNKGPKNFTQHPSVILLIPPNKKFSQSQISGALKNKGPETDDFIVTKISWMYR